MRYPLPPSSPAATLPAARAAVDREIRGLRRRHLAGVAMAAVFVVVAGSIASAAVAAVGTGSCEGGGASEICVRRSWWPFTIQQRAEVWTEGGVPHGPRLEWHRNGAPWFTGAMAHGQRTGLWQECWENGQLRFTGTYVDDRLEGLERWYYPDGTLEWAVEHTAGRRAGIERWYWPSGILRREGRYANGEKDGAFSSFADDGTPTLTVRYRAGVRVGS